MQDNVYSQGSLSLPHIAVSTGDPNGIGPEIVLKTLAAWPKPWDFIPVVAGSQSLFEFYRSTIDAEPGINFRTCTSPSDAQSGFLNFVSIHDEETDLPSPGQIQAEAGKASMESVAMCIEWCLEDKTQAIVTPPISKEAIQAGGYRVPGHTEFLAERTESESHLMMLVNDNLRVALATIHIPLAAVATSLTQNVIVDKLTVLHTSLKHDFRISNPRIAVLGLNPHAGDGGVIGREEIEIIQPALARAEERGIRTDGPFPADGFFGNRMQNNYDAIFAMYHDQGLVPFKTLSFGEGVNFTAGLPIVRTSPDHGTAFAIAGKNRADHKSFAKALRLAVDLSRL